MSTSRTPEPPVSRVTEIMPLPHISIKAGARTPSDGELAALADFVRGEGVRTVLEFGPGRSTEGFLHEGCEVWSFEYQSHWLERYRNRFDGRPGLKLDRFENGPTLRLPDDLAFIAIPPWSPPPYDATPTRPPRHRIPESMLDRCHRREPRDLGRGVEKLHHRHHRP